MKKNAVDECEESTFGVDAEARLSVGGSNKLKVEVGESVCLGTSMEVLSTSGEAGWTFLWVEKFENLNLI